MTEKSVTPPRSELKKLAKSDWIEELSEEEEIMLQKTHRLDTKLKKANSIKLEL